MTCLPCSFRHCLRAVSQALLALLLLMGNAPFGFVHGQPPAPPAASTPQQTEPVTFRPASSEPDISPTPVAADPELPPADTLPAEVAGKPELTTERTTHSATFDLGDGQYAVVQDSQPMHYQDADGAWQRIDPAFVAAAGGWMNNANTLKTGVAARSGRANLTLTQTGVGWEPRSLDVTDAAGTTTPWATVLAETEAVTGTLSADARAVTYPASWSDPALQDRWVSGYGQAEYSLRIEKLPNLAGFGNLSGLATLDLHVTLHLFPGTQLQVNGAPVNAADLPLETSGELAFVSDTGETLWLQPPQAYEEGDPARRVAGSYRLTAGATESSLELAAHIPAAWIAAAERQYPVILDPVFHVKSPTTAKVGFYSNEAQDTFDSWLSTDPIGLGQYPDGVTRAYLRFEMPTLPFGAIIDSARLEVLPKNAFIPCNYNVARPEVCWGAAPRVGLSTKVRAIKLGGPANWWNSDQVPYPAGGESGRLAHMVWSASDGGYNSSWGITDWAQDWLYSVNNFGVMLRLEDEFCYTDYPYDSAYGVDYTIRRFPDGCGVFDIQNPTVYDPEDAANDFTATIGGIRLVVTYTGPTLTTEDAIYSCVFPTCSNPTTGKNYYNTAHEYRVNGSAPAHWQAIVARGLGEDIGTYPPTAITSPYVQTLDGKVLMELRNTQDEMLVDATQTLSSSLSYVLLNRRSYPAPAYRAWIQPNETDSPSDNYSLRLTGEHYDNVVVTAGNSWDSGVLEFDTYAPLELWNLDLPTGSHSRVDIEIIEHNHVQDNNGGPVVSSYDYAQYFKLQLFAGDAAVKGATEADIEGGVTPIGGGDPAHPYHPARLTSGIFTAGANDYGLALVYGGPAVMLLTCTSNCSPARQPNAPAAVEEEPLTFSYRVRVTSCTGDAFPTRAGTCQQVRCPTSNFPAGYRRTAGSLQLWSAGGWTTPAGSTSGASSPGDAPLLGVQGDVAPTVAVVGGVLSYAANGVATIDADSTVMLIECQNAPSAATNPRIAEFSVYANSPMQSTDGMYLYPTAWRPDNTTFDPWDGDGGVLSQNFFINPVQGRVEDEVSLRRRVGAVNRTFQVGYWAYAEGWPSLESYVLPTNNTTLPPVAGALALDVGGFELDTEAAGAVDKRRRFVALRATAATITQPESMGGASEPVQAILYGEGQVNAGLGQPCVNGVNCLDIRAPEDAYPTPVRRDWKMPDIHTNNTAGLFVLSTPGQVQAWSVDHPNAANSPNAAGEEFSFNTSGASVRITQEKCVETDVVETQVIRGETMMTLPMIGDDGASQDTMLAARFKLCGNPDVALRMVEFEFRSPVGVPVGSTGLFVYGMKGTVAIEPEHVNITFAMDFYFSDPNTLNGTGQVMIDTRGYFEFSGDGKLLGTVDANGKLWVAWNPLDTGFEMSLHYGLGNIAAIDGTVRAHAWRGRGWQGKYNWLPDNPEEAHFAAQISASFVIYEGAVIDMWPLVVPPVDFSRSIEIAFGQFCTNNSCSTYEWGIKAALEVCGYHVGVYYGFDHGVSLILGNDGHTLIDQYGGATYAAQAARIPLAAGEELGLRTPGVAIQTAPQAVNGEVSLPITVTANTEELLLGLGWQAGTLTFALYEPDGDLVFPNPAYGIVISDTTHTENGITTHSRLMGVKLNFSGPDMAGIWKVKISGVTPESHYKFAFLANKGAPGTRADRGEFTVPGATDVQSPGMVTLRWRVDADAPANTTINLYYTQYIKVDGVYYPYVNYTDVPIVKHRPYSIGWYQWFTNFSGIPAKCPQSDDDRCYYGIRAIVDDGVNTLTAADISDSGNFCKLCNDIPESAFDPDRFPGTSTFTSVGHIWVADTTAPAAPTGLEASGVAGALLARWTPNTENDLASYLVEWGRVSCPTIDCTWDAGEPSHAERVAPTITPTLRIGGVTAEGMVLGDSYGVVVSAIDVNGNVSARSAIDNARPSDATGVQIPAAPTTPTATSLSSTSVRLNWSSDGDPDHYRLIYRQVMTFATVLQIDDITAHDYIGYRTGTKTLTGLTTGATYEAWVTAANSDDWHSAYSPPVTFTVTSGDDGDGDGMPDDWETTYQISLANSDSDRDGLSNVDEYRNGTQPWEQDSDSDGFSDGEEVISATNPLNAAFYPTGYILPRPKLATNRVHFYVKVGGNETPFQDVDYYNFGGGALALSATETAPWLSASVESGVGKNYVRLMANTTNLTPGIYDTIVRVYQTSGAYFGGQQCIRVRLHLLPADADYPRRTIYLPLMLRDYTPPQWEFTLVDPNGDAGQYTSVAIDPRTGNPYISYYDAGNGNLRMVNPVGPHNGNCGLEQDWRCEVVKPTDDVGRYSSIAIWADASVWKIGIAYYNDTTDSLEYAEFIEGGSWTFTAIDVGEPLLNIRDGRYASLKFNADGAPRIAYYTWNALGTSALKFAEYVGSGGTCSDPAWQCSSIESGDSIGSHAALDLDDADRPHIAYYDSGNDLLRYARLLGGGSGNCGPSNNWQCDTIEAVEVPTFTARLIGLNAIALDEAQIAYTTLVSGTPTLRYAHTASGECGPGNTWACRTIVKNVGGVAVATQGDAPRIVYHDTAGNTLHLARPIETKEIGNCGAAFGGVIKQWACIELDDGGAYPAIALRGSLAIIAHYEATTTALRVAWQQY